MIGVTLDDKYQIKELIGQGGMANVYKARDTRLGRDVAVKILKQEYMDNEQFLKKFLRHLMRRIHHKSCDFPHGHT